MWGNPTAQHWTQGAEQLLDGYCNCKSRDCQLTEMGSYLQLFFSSFLPLFIPFPLPASLPLSLSSFQVGHGSQALVHAGQILHHELHPHICLTSYKEALTSVLVCFSFSIFTQSIFVLFLQRRPTFLVVCGLWPFSFPKLPQSHQLGYLWLPLSPTCSS